MIIGHAPAGYLLGKALRAPAGLGFAALLFGAVAPDLDLIWFYFIDNRAIHHHRYWVHAPGFWVLISLVLVPGLGMIWPKAQRVFLWFVVGALLHASLDGITGGTMWLWPYSGDLFTLITVPATQSHFILSFMLHWTFLIEIALCLMAGVVFWKGRSS